MEHEPKRVIDALSHVDPPISDSQREEAMELIHSEMDIYEPTSDYLDGVPDYIDRRTFQTDLLKQEYDRILPYISEGKQPHQENIDKIKVQPPPTTTLQSKNDSKLMDNEIDQWHKCLNQIKIKLEYRHRQLVRLELLNTHGDSAWNAALQETQNLSSCLEREITDLAKQVQDVSESFEADQQHTAKVLSVLRNEWRTLIEQNHLLATEINRLKSAADI